ncbi:MAG: ABC transporter ATP-binding protein/permease [Oscillospiraceae bacterium]|nr:ABC transporter ATP-binding protein/permease [Oscillospiraceae bacterium]
MNLLYTLPDDNARCLAALTDEQPVYCVPFDLNGENQFTDGYTIVTGSMIYLIRSGELLEKYNIGDYKKARTSVSLGCGTLILDSVAVLNYSVRHLSRYAYIARAINYIIDGRNIRVTGGEKEKLCHICGKPMFGADYCHSCQGTSRTWKRLIELIKPYINPYLVLSVSTFIVMLTGLGIQFWQRGFVNRFMAPDSAEYGQGSVGDIMFFIAVFAAGHLFLQVLNFFIKKYNARLGARLGADLREKMFNKVQEVSLSFINKHHIGEFMNRVMNDVNHIRGFMGDIFNVLLTHIVTMTGSIVVMMILDWKLALLILAFIPALTVIFRTQHRRIHKLYRNQNRLHDRLQTRLQDILSGIRIVKLFGREEDESLRLNSEISRYTVVQTRNEVYWSTFTPIIWYLMSTGGFMVLLFGGIYVLSDKFEIGDLMLFQAFAGNIYGPLRWLSHLPRMLIRTLNCVNRINDVMEERPESDGQNAVKQEIKGEITFDNVSFGYMSYEQVLENINVTIKEGEMVGLVGSSGSGKSTFINLVMGLYRVDEGLVKIDGVDINDLDSANMHRQIGVVLQETYLFAGTILDNLRYAHPTADYEQVIRCAKIANAHDFILKSPDGYNTYVGEGGHTLSGGERQRIAIARAILHDPRILILDEATSSLDTENEHAIQEALGRLVKGRTTIAIAHRLSTLRGADRIIVLDKQKVAESGSHNQLIEAKGIYYNLVTAQLQMHKG